MKNWPPCKAWTSLEAKKDSIHFVAVNYGIETGKRWVNMVSVLDQEINFSITMEELNDENKWSNGWLNNKLDKSDQSKKSNANERKIKQISCNHLSSDWATRKWS